jgi:hypothetical protein
MTTINWSGRTWDVRPPTTNTLPGPNAWDDSTSCVNVNGDGSLTLNIHWDGSNWRCAEIDGPILGYGKYEWIVNSPDTEDFDAQAVLGLFTYDITDDGSHFYSENDIEFSMWGTETETSRVWFTVQPGSEPLEVPGPGSRNPPYTCTMIWQAGQCYFKVADSQRTLAEHIVNSGVQAPGNAKVAVNLWLTGSFTPDSGQDVPVTLQSFTFTAGVTYTTQAASAFRPTFGDVITSPVQAQPGGPAFQRRHRRFQPWLSPSLVAGVDASVTAGLAAATGAALDITPGPTVTALPGTASATGAALQSAAQVIALPGTALATGTAQQPAAQVTAQAGLASATGVAQQPVAQVTAFAGVAAATGTAYQPFISYTAGLATATGIAQQPVAQVTALAGLAAATGIAQQPVAQVTALAGLSAATGIAQQPVAQVTAFDQTGASATGIAYNPFAQGDIVSAPVLPQPGGSSYRRRYRRAQQVQAPAPGAGNATVTAGLAAATGTALDAVAQVTAFDQTGAQGAGIALDAVAQVTAFDQAGALGTGTAYLAGSGRVPTIAAATGTGQQATGVVTIPVPTIAAAAGTAYQSPVRLDTTATAGRAVASGAAYLPLSVVLSPPLTASGFGTFSQVPPDTAVILAVVANIVTHGSNATMAASTYELWDGTSSMIGSRQGTASTSGTHRDSVVFTGVTYSQLATLQLRVYAATLAGNSGATASVDAVSLSVNWVPNNDALVTPAALVVTPATPVFSASGVINTTVTPGVLAVTPALQAADPQGFIPANVLPDTLVVTPAFTAPSVSGVVNTTITPGVLGITPALPDASAQVTANVPAGTLAVTPVVPVATASATASATVTPGALGIAPALPAASGQLTVNFLASALPAITPALPAPDVSAGVLVTIGVMALTPALPAVVDITVPGWTAAEADGGWSNPASVIGPPDGSDATWTVP